MEVFALPTMNIVFKIIKDRFDPPKSTTRQSVMEKYRIVFLHDRVGRLADAQEFENLIYDKTRFDKDLLDFYLDCADLKSGMDKIQLSPSDSAIERILSYSRNYKPKI